MSFHASSYDRKEVFLSDSAVTEDIKAKGFPLNVTTTLSPFETARMASPVLFFRFFAVIVLISVLLSSNLKSIIAISCQICNRFSAMVYYCL